MAKKQGIVVREQARTVVLKSLLYLVGFTIGSIIGHLNPVLPIAFLLYFLGAVVATLISWRME